MKSFRFINLLVAAVFAFGLLPLHLRQPALAAVPAAQNTANNTDAQYVPGEVLVVMAPSLSESAYGARASALAGTLGAAVAQRYGSVALLSADPQADVPALAARLQASGQVQIAQPNYVYKAPEVAQGMKGQAYQQPDYVAQSSSGKSLHLSWEQLNSLRSIKKVGYRSAAVPTFPNELGAGRLWAWDRIQADLIWSEKKVGPLVCVLDTGVDNKHPDLLGKVVLGKDFVNNDSLPADDNGHGTHVAGLIAAKLNNGSLGAAGVSNGSILAVKVLDAQGLGTSYSVTAGIMACGKNSLVKIINMSLGSYATDQIQYNALRTALATRLLVAAAGNDSTSKPFYPAAYADSSIKAPDNTNTIAPQVIAVGAAHSPAFPYQLWVDTDGSGTINPDGSEEFKPEECATGQLVNDTFVYGSNYGRWVTLVAPGEDVYSTTPYATPFYGHFAEGMAYQYDYMNGTSMAAALAAGAAARMWSILPTTTPVINQKVKSALEGRGEALTFAAAATSGVVKDMGYDSPSGISLNNETIKFGVPFHPDGTSTGPMIVAAPFCWPTNNTVIFGDAESMANTKYLNVAKAMKRSALVAEVKDAQSGGPLAGASVAAYDRTSTPAVLRDTTVTTSGSGTVIAINLPAVLDGSGNPVGLLYDLKVSKSGYTSGYQTFDSITAPTADYTGQVYKDNYSSVGLLPTANINFVLDWRDPAVDLKTHPDPDADLDLMLRLPQNADNKNPSQGHEGFIGSGSTWGTYPKIEAYLNPTGFFLGKGTLLDALTTGYPWSPFAVHNYDGGIAQGIDNYGQAINPTESITLKAGAASTATGLHLPLKPYYSKPDTTDNNYYRLFVTDYSQDYSGPVPSPHHTPYLLRDSADENFTAAIVRVWVSGKMITSVKIGDSGLTAGCNNTHDLWKVLEIRGNGTLDIKNTCDSIGSWYYRYN